MQYRHDLQMASKARYIFKATLLVQYVHVRFFFYFDPLINPKLFYFDPKLNFIIEIFRDRKF